MIKYNMLISFVRLIDEKSGFNEDRELLNKLRYFETYCYF